MRVCILRYIQSRLWIFLGRLCAVSEFSPYSHFFLAFFLAFSSFVMGLEFIVLSPKPDFLRFYRLLSSKDSRLFSDCSLFQRIAVSLVHEKENEIISM